MRTGSAFVAGVRVDWPGTAAVFVDASVGCASPFSFEEVEADPRLAPLSHALSPAELLGVCHRVNGSAPPPR